MDDELGVPHFFAIFRNIFSLTRSFADSVVFHIHLCIININISDKIIFSIYICNIFLSVRMMLEIFSE